MSICHRLHNFTDKLYYDNLGTNFFENTAKSSINLCNRRNLWLKCL
jgi:hypothetical protein